MYSRHKIIDLLGRSLLSATFFISIPPKLLNFTAFIDSIAGRGIPIATAKFLLIGAIACLLLGSTLLLLGRNRIASILLIVFLLPTTFIFHFHPFQIHAFFVNFGLIGALLIIFNNSNTKSRTSANKSIFHLKKLITSYFDEKLDR